MKRLFVLLFAATSASAALYDVVNLENYFGSITSYRSVATGINNLGQVSGVYGPNQFGQSGFVYAGGGITDLGGGNTTVFGINNAGQVAGYEFDSAFRYTPGVGAVSLGGFGGMSSYAYGINEQGQVAGTAELPNGLERAFRYTEGAGLQELGSLFGGYSQGSDINNHGWVTGRSDGDNVFLYRDGPGMTYLGPGFGRAINDNGLVVGRNNSLATMYRDGQTLYLGDLGGNQSEARDINSLDMVVGTSINGDNRFRAFLWTEAGGMMDLNSLIGTNSGWTLVQAFGINDAGQIVGEGNFNGRNYAVLLNPVPEPSTWALLLLGTGTLYFLRRRRV